MSLTLIVASPHPNIEMETTIASTPTTPNTTTTTDAKTINTLMDSKTINTLMDSKHSSIRIPIPIPIPLAVLPPTSSTDMISRTVGEIHVGFAISERLRKFDVVAAIRSYLKLWPPKDRIYFDTSKFRNHGKYYFRTPYDTGVDNGIGFIDYKGPDKGPDKDPDKETESLSQVIANLCILVIGTELGCNLRKELHHLKPLPKKVIPYIPFSNIFSALRFDFFALSDDQLKIHIDQLMAPLLNRIENGQISVDTYIRIELIEEKCVIHRVC